MYNVVSIIYGIVTSVFTGYCLTYYFDSFMERRKKFQWNGKYLLIILYEVLDYLLDYLFQTSIETKETIGKQIIFLIVVFVFAKLFYRSGLQLPVFLTITFVSLKDLSAFISTTISLCSEQVFDLWLLLLEIGSISIETTDKLVNGTASIVPSRWRDG